MFSYRNTVKRKRQNITLSSSSDDDSDLNISSSSSSSDEHETLINNIMTSTTTTSTTTANNDDDQVIILSDDDTSINMTTQKLLLSSSSDDENDLEQIKNQLKIQMEKNSDQIYHVQKSLELIQKTKRLLNENKFEEKKKKKKKRNTYIDYNDYEGASSSSEHDQSFYDHQLEKRMLMKSNEYKKRKIAKKLEQEQEVTNLLDTILQPSTPHNNGDGTPHTNKKSNNLTSITLRINNKKIQYQINLNDQINILLKKLENEYKKKKFH